MEKRINCGYEIINAMQLKNQFGTEMEIVMGHNEKAVSPFVTWAYYPNTNCYDHGHYFGTKEAVTRDFFERGMKEMALDLRTEYSKEDAVLEIKDALEEGFNREQAEGLLLNEDFMARTIHKYYNIDRSAEYEALCESVEDIYASMVENKEILDFELVEKLQDQTVNIFLQNDVSYNGEVYWNPKNTLSGFYLKVPGASENERPQWIEINLCDITKIELGGKEIYPQDLSGMDLVDLKNEILGGLIRIEEYDEPTSVNLQEQLIEYCARNDEMRLDVSFKIDLCDVLYDSDKEDLEDIISKHINSSQKTIAKRLEMYCHLDTLVRENFMEILKKSFLELHSLDKKLELDKKINDAGYRLCLDDKDKNLNDRDKNFQR